MEAEIDGQRRSRLREIFLIAVLVLALRLPFLNQAIQGDDVYYLAGAEHALIDPAHPNHARYIFQGELVDMRGHPHPPFNAWVLGALLAAFGDVYEVPFHAFYIVFSLIAALAMYWLAARFSDRPLYPALLFCAVPAFVINGNSLESDLPFLAFWMLGVAAFVWGRYGIAAVSLVLAALAAYQAIVATPILLVWVWLHARRSRAAWVTTFVPVLTFAAFQIFERATSGALPAGVLAGYFSSYGLQQLSNKLRNALALSVHFCFLLFPPLAFLVLRRLRRDFLSAWVVIFFVSALALFFAGSARYLLPLAAPVCLLAAEGRRPKVLVAAALANLALWGSLAVVNCQHWDGYRRFASEVARDLRGHRLWVNGEWGLRYYMEAAGAMPVERDRSLRPGDMVVTSELGYPLAVSYGGGTPQVVLAQTISSRIPLRLIGLESHSGYSTASAGFLPFDITTTPIDRVRAEAIMDGKPRLSVLPMNAPDAAQQIVSGVYGLEANGWRWMGARGIFMLKQPDQPSPLSLKLYLPDNAPGRTITLFVDGRRVTSRTLVAPGSYTLNTPPVKGTTVVVELDRTFSVPGDDRQLGMIVNEIGYR